MPKPNRSRLIRVDGQKIIEARRKLELKQQALSDDAEISLRTLQRAEKGGPISKKTLNNIATGIRINPDELIIMDESNEETASKNGYGILILKPVLSYRDVAKFVAPWNEFTLDVEYLINPPDELIEPIADIIAAFEDFCVPMTRMENNVQSHSEIFKKRMSLNKKIKIIIDSGFSIFSNYYKRQGLIWNVESSYDGQVSPHWVGNTKEFFVLRFVEDVPKDKDSITIKVKYGLSDEVMLRWHGDTRQEISQLHFLKHIESEDMIDPNIEPLPDEEKIGVIPGL